MIVSGALSVKVQLAALPFNETVNCASRPGRTTWIRIENDGMLAV